jgi:hypothetical protein
MKKPTLEEVKEFFKDAKEVLAPYRTAKKREIDDISLVEKCHFGYQIKEKNGTDKITLFYSDYNEYSKIISYKSNPNIDLSKLTPELITELCKDENAKEILINNGVVTEPKKEETYIKIPLSIITLTESDKKLGALVRSISENY